MPRKKLKVGVLMGGPSAEREISFITGQAVCDNLDKSRYKIIPIEMSVNRRFFALKPRRKLIDLYRLKQLVDIVFIALHGQYGEDGGVQGLLEALDIKYTGSNVLASALAMNKDKSAALYSQCGLLIPKHISFCKTDWGRSRKSIISIAKTKVGFPSVVKPVDQGSSVGTFIVKKEKDLIAAIIKALKTSEFLIVQEFINGQEATCGVLEKKGQPFALPPTRIIANIGQFYDYESKYADGGSTHVCPADFSKAINKKIQDIALTAHKTLGCRGVSRTDVFVAKKPPPFKEGAGGRSLKKAESPLPTSPLKGGGGHSIYVIETNTIPGMTPVSLLPEAAGKVGISFSKLLDLIIQAS